MFISVLCSVYLVEYTLNSNSMIEICTRTLTLLIKSYVSRLCKNLDYKPQSSNHGNMLLEFSFLTEFDIIRPYR